MVLFACLDILCLRETVFWITGMMNYLFPAVVFLFGYLMFLKSRAGELKGMGLALYLMVCLLAASSVEQFALMFVGMMTLHHGYDVIKKVRIPLYEWGVFGLSLIGLATLILAPGNFSRVDEQGLLMPPFIDNAWTLFYQNTGSPVAIPYIFMLAVIVMMSCMGTKKGMLSRTMAVNGVCVVGCVIAPLLDNAIFIVVMMLLLGWQIIVLLVREKAHFGPQIYFLIFVGIGSQVMLLISAVWGFRCMLSMYMVYMLLIGCLLYHMDVDHRRYVLIAGLLMSIHPVLALVFCSVLMVRKQAWRAFLDKALPVALRCVVVLVMVGLLMGYAKNAPIHRQNLRRTAEIQGDMIVIEELPNDIYSWYFVPISEFHEEYYRLLHEIPENVEIVYEKLHE